MPSLSDLLRMGKQYISDALPGGSLNPEMQPIADRAKYIAGGIGEDSPMNRDLQSWHGKTQRGLSDLIAGNEGPQADYGYAQMMNMAGVAPVGMTAWHGSPHKFDKFSLDAIGTGEGAQAYGHGLYLAESPDVAKSYAENLANRSVSPSDLVSINGKSLKEVMASAPPMARAKVTSHIVNAGGDVALAQKTLDEFVAKWKDKATLNGQSDLAYAQQWMKQLADQNITFKPKPAGELYKTDIPDEAVARFLDWDKPLSQQAPEVQKLLANYGDADKRKILDLVRGGEQPDGFGIAKSADGFAPIINGEVVGNGAKDLTFKSMDEVLGYISKQIPSTDPTAASIYRRMVNEHGGSDAISQAQVSGLLQQQGIPGIRYLDGGSRSAGQGSSNFVAFDPEMIRILERNGVPTGQKPWNPNEYRPLSDLMNPRID